MKVIILNSPWGRKNFSWKIHRRYQHKCEWRTDEWLKVSLKSLPQFMNQESVINTTGLSIPEITEMTIR